MSRPELLRNEAGAPLVFFQGARPGCDYSIQDVYIPETDAAYFTTNLSYASGFTKPLFDDSQPCGMLHRVHLAFRSPKRLRFPDDFEFFSYRGFNRLDLMAQGYDGLILVLPAQDAEPPEVLAAVFDRRSIIPLPSSTPSEFHFHADSCLPNRSGG